MTYPICHRTAAFKFLFYYYRFSNKTKYTLYADTFKDGLLQITIYTVRSKFILNNILKQHDFMLTTFNNSTKNLYSSDINSLKHFLSVVFTQA